MLTQDLLLLDNGIDVWDKTLNMVTDPVAIGTLLATRGKSGTAFTLAQTKTALKNAGITSIAGMSIDAALQQLVNGDKYPNSISTCSSFEVK